MPTPLGFKNEVNLSTSIVGFDSAWADNPKAPGALCVLRQEAPGRWSLVEPLLVSFDQAATIIEHERANSRRCVVALDQPTIVPNLSSCRPCERVAGSLVSWVGGGVQPANRSKASMFGDGAPLWRFKKRLAASDDPELARIANTGLFLMEVFPALALPSMEASFHSYLGGPRYNPKPRSKFRHADWLRVLDAASSFGSALGAADVSTWCAQHRLIPTPRKGDQDKLDAVICALIALNWLTAPRVLSVMIGDLTTGYIVAPATVEVRARLTKKARECGVAIDGILPASNLV